jgi:hypothetical protein
MVGFNPLWFNRKESSFNKATPTLFPDDKDADPDPENDKKPMRSRRLP